jgi:hypothetical protein
MVEKFYQEGLTRGSLSHRDSNGKWLTLYPIYDAMGDNEGYQYFAMICTEEPPAIDSYWNGQEPPKHTGYILPFHLGDYE